MKLWFVILFIVVLAATFLLNCNDDVKDEKDSGSDADDEGPADDDSGDNDSVGDDDTPDDDDIADDDDATPETMVFADDLPIIRLKGDAYSRGYELGRVAGDRMIEVYQEYILKFALGLSPEYCTLFKAVKDLGCSVLVFTEEEMQQIQGIADAVQDNWDAMVELVDGTEMALNENDICIANAIADFSQMACSSVSAWGSLAKDGQTIIARNLDWEPGPDNMLGPETIIVSETPEDESWHFISVTFPGLVGCLSCMNGDGDAVFIHDTQRFHDNFIFRLAPRILLLRRALIAAENSQNKTMDFEAVLEVGQIDTGNNFHFVTRHIQGESGAVNFEVDDNESHPDGKATVRTSADHDASGTQIADALFVTNHHRKRYPPSECWRYDSLKAWMEQRAEEPDPSLSLDDLHESIKEVELGELTVHTILFKPDDWTFRLYLGGPDRLASEDSGVTVPRELLFPW